VEDEAAYLRERVRVGDLTQERLELAAWIGSGAARLEFPDRHWIDLPEGALTSEQVSLFLKEWGKPLASAPVRNRACLALARSCLRSNGSGADCAGADLVISATERFLANPVEDLRADLQRLSNNLKGTLLTVSSREAAWSEALTLIADTGLVVAGDPEQLLQPFLTNPKTQLGIWLRVSARLLGPDQGLRAALHAVQEELTAWLLQPEPIGEGT